MSLETLSFENTAAAGVTATDADKRTFLDVHEQSDHDGARFRRPSVINPPKAEGRGLGDGGAELKGVEKRLPSGAVEGDDLLRTGGGEAADGVLAQAAFQVVGAGVQQHRVDRGG